jgi:hypothetical protein
LISNWAKVSVHTTTEPRETDLCGCVFPPQWRQQSPIWNNKKKTGRIRKNLGIKILKRGVPIKR